MQSVPPTAPLECTVCGAPFNASGFQGLCAECQEAKRLHEAWESDQIKQERLEKRRKAFPWGVP